MICHVVAEGKTDTLVLQHLLEPEVPRGDARVRIIGAGGWSLADSTARTILAVHREPVALVVDADATSPDRVDERRQFLEWSLRSVASSPSLFRVFLFVPQMEALFFEGDIPKQLRRHFKPGVRYPLTAEMKLEAKYAPRRVLEEVGLGADRLARVLHEIDLGAAKAAPVAADFRKFVLEKSARSRSDALASAEHAHHDILYRSMW